MESKQKLTPRVVASVIAAGIMSFSGVVVESSMNVTFPTLMGEFGISTAVVQHDYDTSPIDGEDGIGLWFEADARLQRAASEAARQLGLRVHHGVVASGDRFISGADEAAALLARFPKAICAEMEAGSVAQVCTHYDIPFIVLRSLSDVAVKAGNAMTFEEYKEAASRRSAALCSSFIKGLRAMH